MAVGDVYQITVVGLHHGQQVVNVLHYQVLVGAAADYSAELANLWSNQNLNNYRACCSAEYRCTGLLSQKVKPIPALTAVSLTIGEGTGTGSANSLPSSNSVVITKRSAIAGRTGRGRIYMPGVPTTFEDNSQVTGAGLNVYNNFAQTALTMENDGSTLQVQMTLLSRKTLTTRLVVSVDARPILRNQRRRQVGRGS